MKMSCFKFLFFMAWIGLFLGPQGEADSFSFNLKRVGNPGFILTNISITAETQFCQAFETATEAVENMRENVEIVEDLLASTPKDSDSSEIRELELVLDEYRDLLRMLQGQRDRLSKREVAWGAGFLIKNARLTMESINTIEGYWTFSPIAEVDNSSIHLKTGTIQFLVLGGVACAYMEESRGNFTRSIELGIEDLLKNHHF